MGCQLCAEQLSLLAEICAHRVTAKFEHRNIHGLGGCSEKQPNNTVLTRVVVSVDIVWWMHIVHRVIAI